MTDRAEQKMRFLFTLRSEGITDKRTLTAMEKIDRADFVREPFSAKAYENTPLPIASGQTISQPTVVGMMTQALDIKPRNSVLEIGTGSGYQAAILSRLARRVYSIERFRSLAAEAKKVFDRLGLENVIVITADGTRGLPDQAPFDRIIITAATEDPPPPLLDQLRVGGIMVLPVGQTDQVQRLLRIDKTKEGLEYTELGNVRFVPLVEGMPDE